MSRTFKFAIAAFAVSMTLAPAAMAQVGVERMSIRVAYGDLNMANAAGGATLLKRIESAARKVCDDATMRSPLKPRSVSRCRKDTVESTVRQLEIGTLTLAWNGAESSQVQLSAR